MRWPVEPCWRVVDVSCEPVCVYEVERQWSVWLGWLADLSASFSQGRSKVPIGNDRDVKHWSKGDASLTRGVPLTFRI